MPITPNITNSLKYRTRRLHLKYFDYLQKHPNRFELNIIGFGYTFRDEILSHRLSVGDITASAIELDAVLSLDNHEVHYLQMPRRNEQ